MRKSVALALFVVIAFAPAWAADAPAAKPAAAPQPTTDEVIAQFRTDLQAASADVVAKALTLTADQAAKFWPLFQQYQAEQSAIIDAQLKAATKYADNYANLTDADSLAYVTALLQRDDQIHALRVKWLAKFQTVVPAGTAARAIHVDRRLGLVAQIKLASKIPLVH